MTVIFYMHFVRVVTTGWTGMDMSSPSLPEGVPFVDADLMSLEG